MIKSKTTKMWGKVKGCVRWQKTTPYSNHIENVLLWKWLMNMPQTWQTKTLICLFFQLKKHYYTYTYEKTNTWCKIILVFSFQNSINIPLGNMKPSINKFYHQIKKEQEKPITTQEEITLQWNLKHKKTQKVQQITYHFWWPLFKVE